MIKAVVFDLDDTLMDTSGLLGEIAKKRIAQKLIDHGLNCASWEDAYKKIDEYKQSTKISFKAFKKTIEFYGPKSDAEKLFSVALAAYYDEQDDDIRNIHLFPEVKPTLKILSEKYKLVLVTSGNSSTQWKKIDALGIRNNFDLIIIDDVKEKQLTKRERLMAAQVNFDLKPEEILVVGDKIGSEIKSGNMLGMKTVQMLHGIYKDYIPQKTIEEPLFRIKKISELVDITHRLDTKKDPKIVVVGGGTGAPSMLRGLKKYTDNLVGVIGVTDSGRSSGLLRKDFDMAPPGDIRNNLIALSGAEKLMSDLFQYRFENGSLEGHSFGNLLITALMKVTGSFESAVEEAGKFLNIKGRVLPSSSDNFHINAEFEDGAIVQEENNIVDRHNSDVHLRPRIKKVFLSKNPKANKQAIEEIMGADIVVIGPGSLFTSVITNLLVKGIRDAIIKTNAKKIYIGNIMTQPSQTYGFHASDHIREIERYLGEGVLDYVIFNTQKPSDSLMKQYQKEHADFVEIDDQNLSHFQGEIIRDNIVQDTKRIKILRNKKNLLRHDSNKIAKIIIDIYVKNNNGKNTTAD